MGCQGDMTSPVIFLHFQDGRPQPPSHPFIQHVALCMRRSAIVTWPSPVSLLPQSIQDLPPLASPASNIFRPHTTLTPSTFRLPCSAGSNDYWRFSHFFVLLPGLKQNLTHAVMGTFIFVCTYLICLLV